MILLSPPAVDMKSVKFSQPRSPGNPGRCPQTTLAVGIVDNSRAAAQQGAISAARGGEGTAGDIVHIQQ